MLALFALVALVSTAVVSASSNESIRELLFGRASAGASKKGVDRTKPVWLKRLSVSAVTAAEATVTTNRTDYAPGATVVITGSGWQPGEVVALRIDESDNDAPWQASVIADDSGSIYNADFVIQTHDLGVSFTLTALGSFSGQTAQTTFTDSNASLDQFANDPPVEWVNGNLGASKSTYFEGDSIPYRLTFSGLTLDSHTVTIEWDTTKSSKHAIDYLTDFDRSVGTLADPCVGVAGCSGPTSIFAIPADPQVTGAGVTPIAGSFKFYGGTITAVSAYSYHDGTGFTGDKSARITITFTAGVDNPVLAWGGHIATRPDWGQSNSAVSISGSPYHTRLIDLDGSGGNQDRSLSADAVIFPGSIKIIKDTVPDGPRDFTFSATGGLIPSTFILDDDADPTHINNQLFSNILVTAQNGNDYSITETPVTGWNLGSPIVCSVTSPNGGSQSGTTNGVNINLREGENVTCTFVNTEDENVTKGKIKIVKQTLPDGSTQSFHFTPSGYGSGFDLTDGQDNTSAALTPSADGGGPYSVTEGAVAGWTSDGGSCDHGTPSDIQVLAGTTTMCTFTNTQIPKLTLDKITNYTHGGTAPESSWTLTADGGTAGMLSGPGAAGHTDVVSGATFKAGTYTLSESAAPTGYTNGTAYSCVKNGGGAVSGNSITLAPGDTAVCSITNTDNAPSLTLDKITNYTHGGTAPESSWTLTADGGTAGMLSGPGAAGHTDVVSDGSFKAGTYALSESAAPAGYTNGTAYSCVKNGGGAVSGNSITLAVGDTAVCSITNTDIAPSLTLDKITSYTHGGTAPESSWTLTADGGTAGTLSGAGAAGHTDVVSGGSFKAGTYALSESAAPAGYTNGTAYSCVKNGGAPVAGNSITLAVGDTAVCSITNTDIAPVLKVVKALVPSNDTGRFNLRIDGTHYTSSPNDPAGDGDATAFVPVTAGVQHTVDETAVVGVLSDYVVTIGGACDSSGHVTLGLGGSATCTITNTKKGMAQVIKTFRGGAVTQAPGSGFNFQIREGASTTLVGTTLESLEANNVNGGTLNFTTKLVPGNTYQMCEIVMPGWLSTLGTFVPNSFMPPDGVAVNPNVDNSIVCGNFTVAAAETKVFTIDNTPPPGGRALTIGFWKNWASCASSSGKQKPVLDQTLASFTIASGQTTHGVYIGDLYVDTCSEAVAILNKTDLNGKKQSSDAAFNLAAQLLAAKLNVQAGAGACGPVLTAINQAQALLDFIDFNGLTHKKMTPAQTALANCLATWLDDYNNDRASACNASRSCP